MTRTEVIAIAREADPFGDDGRLVSLAMLTPETLERFAALVAAKEREACAQICDHFANAKDYGGNEYMRSKEAQLAAARIRARGAP